MKKAILFVSLVLIFIGSCTFEKGDIPKKVDAFKCDSTVHYSTINNIVNNFCDGDACHGTTTTESIVLVDNYGNLKSEVDKGKLLERVITLKNMPAAGPIDDSLISRIHCWITEGGPHN